MFLNFILVVVIIILNMIAKGDEKKINRVDYIDYQKISSELDIFIQDIFAEYILFKSFDNNELSPEEMSSELSLMVVERMGFPFKKLLLNVYSENKILEIITIKCMMLIINYTKNNNPVP